MSGIDDFFRLESAVVPRRLLPRRTGRGRAGRRLCRRSLRGAWHHAQSG
jgi:hypothetical protein